MMIPLTNAPPALIEKMKKLQENCLSECMNVMDRNLEGQLNFVAVSVYYETVMQMLFGMADELQQCTNSTPDQTADMLIQFMTTCVNLHKDDVKMSMKANTSEQGSA